jgi:DNA-dependent RNA polymerase auxiliary subunit epsilon
MDVLRYQVGRQKELEDFQKEYADLKIQYSQLLTQAAYESDTSKQAELIKQVLSVNSTLAQHVRDFVQKSSGKFDRELISKLSSDIIRYQKEFTDIQSSSNKSRTLQLMLNKERSQLVDLDNSFFMWLCILLGLIGIVLMLIFTRSIGQLWKASTDLASSISTPESGSTSLGSDAF